jgi:hypothetical protein
VANIIQSFVIFITCWLRIHKVTLSSLSIKKPNFSQWRRREHGPGPLLISVNCCAREEGPYDSQITSFENPNDLAASKHPVTVTREEFEAVIVPLIDRISREMWKILDRTNDAPLSLFGSQFMAVIAEFLQSLTNFTNPKPSTMVSAHECFAFGAGYSFIPNDVVGLFCERPTDPVRPEKLIEEYREKEAQ